MFLQTSNPITQSIKPDQNEILSVLIRIYSIEFRSKIIKLIWDLIFNALKLQRIFIYSFIKAL